MAHVIDRDRRDYAAIFIENLLPPILPIRLIDHSL